MLAQLTLALAPLKLFMAGGLFLVLAWYGAKALIGAAIGAVTAGETGFNLAREQLHLLCDPASLAATSLVVQTARVADLPVGGTYVLFALGANALLAAAAVLGVHGLKCWIKAKAAEHEQALDRAIAARRAGDWRRL